LQPACWLVFCKIYCIKIQAQIFHEPGTPPLQSARLLDQVRERVRYLHYSLKTEKAYLYWIRFFIRWVATQGAGMRHPRDMGAKEVEAFLSMMANERKVSASTHNQALSALMFLYREVLNIDLAWLNNIGRPQQTKRIPSVLTQDEVVSLLAQLEGVTAPLARVLYGTGMRLMEGMRLRIKDVDFDRHVIIVREAKGSKVAAGGTASPLDALQTLDMRQSSMLLN
jgi:site-specific recombinase XerD